MTDAAWHAIKDIAVALCSLLAALFAKQAARAGQENAQKLDETTERLAAHEESSAERGRLLKQELQEGAPGRLRPPAPPSEVRDR